MHSATSPVIFIRFTQCQDSSKVCYIGEDYAWVDSTKQFYSSGTNPINSQIFQKSSIGKCASPQDIRQNLLPGRNCSYDTQCLNGLCNSAGRCAGKAINEPCAQSSECDINLGCISSTRTFPWQTICKKLLYAGDSCEDDYQCGYDMVCSYMDSISAFNNIKVCINKYSLADGTVSGFRAFYNDVKQDSLANGMKCASGICRARAPTECVCTSIVNVTSDYGAQNDNTYYQCSAMSQYNACQYNYLQDDDGDGIFKLSYLKMDCQCSLDGSVGYCAMPGQSQLSNYIQAMTQIQTYAQNCHTADRYNLQAQMECGIGTQYVNIADLYSLIETKFKFEFFPYVQYQSQRLVSINPCLNQGHPESPINIIKQTNLLRNLYTSTTQ